HESAANPPGEAKLDNEIVATLFNKIKQMYIEEGGVFPEPIVSLDWQYAVKNHPTGVELAHEINGRALTDLVDEQGQVTVHKGQLLSSFGQLTDDGRTACGMWINVGSWTEQGNQMARRDNADPSGLAMTQHSAWAWPANRRILYNRASADAHGKPLNTQKRLIEWNGSQWVGIDVPDYVANLAPEKGAGAFIMNAEGVARIFAEKQLI